MLKLPEVTLVDLDWPVPAHADLAVLERVVEVVKPRGILEFGTAYGNMTACLCDMAKNAHVHTINRIAAAEDRKEKWSTCELTQREIGRVYRALGYADRVTQIYADTRDFKASAYFGVREDPVIDLAIIDACHTEERVTDDFHEASIVLSVGGVVLLHDTHPSREQHLAGSYDACCYLQRCGYDIRWVSHSWWGIWIRGGFECAQGLLRGEK